MTLDNNNRRESVKRTSSSSSSSLLLPSTNKRKNFRPRSIVTTNETKYKKPETENVMTNDSNVATVVVTSDEMDDPEEKQTIKNRRKTYCKTPLKLVNRPEVMDLSIKDGREYVVDVANDDDYVVDDDENDDADDEDDVIVGVRGGGGGDDGDDDDDVDSACDESASDSGFSRERINLKKYRHVKTKCHYGDKPESLLNLLNSSRENNPFGIDLSKFNKNIAQNNLIADYCVDDDDDDDDGDGDDDNNRNGKDSSSYDKTNNSDDNEYNSVVSQVGNDGSGTNTHQLPGTQPGEASAMKEYAESTMRELLRIYGLASNEMSEPITKNVHISNFSAGQSNPRNKKEIQLKEKLGGG
ncbi:conserved hypothetical protein [Pediculus humanus corporis]|uniref:Uncharacterized protein n=1 Tax=Pediculus humanus subsp. corporis TaxID=121224 RepID=E0VGV4_PEDHC|nr:uncharacterized protein Phum_PHUM193880 [Pediculus humanus corporis]EEB12610.1 conserved hypothetical protein [Pediculus humanus corporis]